jgi:CRP-like cAMP-binding protein
MDTMPLLTRSYTSHLRVLQTRPIFSCKDVLPLKPGKLWRIESGVVRSFTWDEDGRPVTLGFWGPGEMVGYPLSRMKLYQVECLTEVEISEVSLDDDYLHQMLILHAWKSEELLTIVHHPSVLERLSELLCWLAKQFGQAVDLGTQLDLRLTHQDLADTIGSTRVSVTRLLKQMEQDGKIERSQRKITLLAYLPIQASSMS